jgi:two-component system chemotaxis sensor kinase CheA
VSPERPPAEFSSEATETAEALGRSLLLLEAGPEDADPDLLNAVFRHAHSLKGLAGTFGQQHMAELAHAAEDLLDRLRLGKARRTRTLLDLLLEAVEVLRRLATDPVGPAKEARALAKKLSRRERKTEREEEDPLDRLELPAEMRRVFTEFEEHRLRETLRKGALVWQAEVQYPLDTFDQELETLKARLHGAGELISTLPGPVAGNIDALAFVLLIGSGVGEEALHRAFSGTGARLRPLGFRKARPDGANLTCSAAAGIGRRGRPRGGYRPADGLIDAGESSGWWGRRSAPSPRPGSCRRGPGRRSSSASTGSWSAGWTSSRRASFKQGWFRSSSSSIGCSGWCAGWPARQARTWCSRRAGARSRSTSGWWRS